MLITGSMNTIMNNFMDETNSTGLHNPSNFWQDQQQGGKEWPQPAFNHPFLQAWFMFLGEATVMVAFLIQNYRAGKQDPAARWTNRHGWKGTFCYALTASCDLTATSLMYAGQALTGASIFQMLRGSVIIFTAMVAVIFLKKRLPLFQWCSIFVVVTGVAIVGVQSVLESGSSGGSGSILGVLLIIGAQIIVAFQMNAQERFLTKFETPLLRLVGLEGIFGCIILGVLLVPMRYVTIDGYPIEDVADALTQIRNSPGELTTRPNWHWNVGNALVFASIGNIVSIAFFNVFGIAITKVLSASHRMVLDSVRTCVVWLFALIVAWETFHIVQLVGFVIMLFGIATYNEFIRLPQIFIYGAQADEVEALDKDARDVPLNTGSDKRSGTTASTDTGVGLSTSAPSFGA